jgi:hypothetical protein
MKIKIVDNNSTRQRTYFKEYKNKRSKYKGVYLNPILKKKPWIVKICIKMKYLHIGSFLTEVDAAAAYDMAVSELLESPQLNKIEFHEVLEVKLSSRALERLNTRLLKLKELIKIK